MNCCGKNWLKKTGLLESKSKHRQAKSGRTPVCRFFFCHPFTASSHHACGTLTEPCENHPVLILLNKPYGILSQFTAEGRWRGLGDCIQLPKVRAAGRLDADSEGLLLLTDNGSLQARLAHPRHHTCKTYWAQVEGDISQEALAQLRRGIVLNDGPTRPATVRRIEPPADLWPRTPPIRIRRHIPTSWLELTISEGRNRQVRRMTAAVGFPTLRLIRYAVASWTLHGLAPAAWRAVPEAEIRQYLHLNAIHHETSDNNIGKPNPRANSPRQANRRHRQR